MDFLPEDEKWMLLALQEAEQAGNEGEIPVGAVVVRGDEMIAVAHNLCESTHDATAHAERLAIAQACQRLGTWRLSDCTLYVTMEPCPMCAGAVINARIPRVIYGIKDPRAGAFGSLLDLSNYPLEGRPQCYSGLLEKESRGLLSDFFAKLREKHKK